MRRRRLLPRLLGAVTGSHWRQHWVRTTLVAAGVALGVATIVAIADISASVLASFRLMVESVGGASDLEITSDAGFIDPGLLDRVVDTPGVVAADGVVEAFLPLSDRPDEAVYVLGVDLLGSTVWEKQLPREAIEMRDELEFLAHGDSVVLTRALADRLGLGLGSTLEVVAPEGVRTLRIRGLLADTPVARLFDGAVMVMDLPRAQALLSRENQLDRIGVRVRPDLSIAEMRTRLAARVGALATVAEPEARGAQGEKLLVSLRSMLVVAGSLAVIVGALIVYQAVSVSVQQRRRQFALLNAIGVARRTLVQLCLVETTILAVAGVVLGELGGHLLGRVAAGLAGDVASAIWVRVDVFERVVSPAGTILGIVIGIAVALAAAYTAVRAAFVVSTVEALRPSFLELGAAPRVRRSMILGFLLIGSTWIISVVPPSRRLLVVGVIIGSQFAAYIAAMILGPTIVLGGGRWLGRRGGRSRRLWVRLAADNLPRTPERAGMTVATITAAIGMVVSLSGLVQSFEGAWTDWIDQHFAADLFVGGGTRVRMLAGPSMSALVGEQLANLPGVETVEPFRVIRTQLAGRPVFLQGISVRDRVAHGGLAMVEGVLGDAVPALENGRGVLLSDNLAYRLGLHRGDQVSLGTPQGPRAFRIEGTFVDFLGSLDLGAVAVSTGQLGTIWGDRMANLFRVWLRPGVSASEVRALAVAKLGRGYYAITAGEFREALRSVWRQFFVVSWVLVAVAMLVAVIGIVNAQLATVLDRAPEIAMLRTIGVARGDITRSILLECAAQGGLGALCGLALGSMLSAQFVLVSMRLLTGWRLAFDLPLGPLLVAAGLAVVVSALAGWVPARIAGLTIPTQPSFD